MMIEKLNRFINNENRVEYRQDLDNVLTLLDYFGNPHTSIKTIHIAGTNGKGSVAHMLNGIFTKSGYSTGLFTSPHLLEINERIRIQNEPIPERKLGRYVDEVDACADSTGIMPTYFDILTACAFRYFSDKNVDIAIIETGLGGRLDSTNVITPLCAIITSISMDHTRILGDSLAAIAGEKAGIIKKKVPAVTLAQDREAGEIIESVAKKMQADLFVSGKEFFTDNIFQSDDGYRFDFRLNAAPRVLLENIILRSPLAVQIDNSSLAITASIIARTSFPELSDGNIKLGIKYFTVPGRCQVLSTSPFIFFDPAHNEAAINLMLQYVEKRYGHMAVTLVLTIMKDKNIDTILSILKKFGKPVIYYVLNDDRCYQPAGPHLSYFKKIIVDDEAALGELLDEVKSENTLFFFTGSFRLYRVALHYAEKNNS
jgi:dihydrofolate synthase/folylpolyglutamate synthase